MVICLERGADLHMFQLMPLPLTVSSVKSRLVLPFWYQLTQVVPEKGPLNVCVCVCMCVVVLWNCNGNTEKTCCWHPGVSRSLDLLLVLQTARLHCQSKHHTCSSVCVRVCVYVYLCVSLLLCLVVTVLLLWSPIYKTHHSAPSHFLLAASFLCHQLVPHCMLH